MNEIKIQIKMLMQGFKDHYIVATSIFVFLLSIFITVAFVIEDKYQANALLKYSDEDVGSNFSVASPLEGIGALGGINLGGNSVDPIDYSIAVIKSRVFLEQLLEKPDIKRNLVAYKNYDKEGKTLSFNTDIYNPETSEWIKEINFLKIHNDFYIKNLNLTKNRSNGFLNISFNHVSPEFSKYFIDLIVEELNKAISIVDINNSEKRLELLIKRSNQNTKREVRDALSRLIENEFKKIAYSKTKAEYMLETIDPAFIPNKAYYPNRLLIILLGFVIGLISSTLYVFIKNSSEEKDIDF